jgi:hypothetical protein
MRQPGWGEPAKQQRHRLTISMEPIPPWSRWEYGPTECWVCRCSCNQRWSAVDFDTAQCEGDCHLILTTNRGMLNHIWYTAYQFTKGNREVAEVKELFRNVVSAMIPQPRDELIPEQAERREHRRVNHEPRVCPYCNEQFKPKNVKQVYCRPSHRAMNFKRERKLKQQRLATG